MERVNPLSRKNVHGNLTLKFRYLLYSSKHFDLKVCYTKCKGHQSHNESNLWDSM